MGKVIHFDFVAAQAAFQATIRELIRSSGGGEGILKAIDEYDPPETLATVTSLTDFKLERKLDAAYRRSVRSGGMFIDHRFLDEPFGDLFADFSEKTTGVEEPAED
jgi:hypothetical protein